MPPTKTTKKLTSPTKSPSSKKRKSLASPSMRSNTPKKDDNKQLKLDSFFSKQKTRKVEIDKCEPLKISDSEETVTVESSPIKILKVPSFNNGHDITDESDESPVPIKMVMNPFDSKQQVVLDESSSSSQESSSSSTGQQENLKASLSFSQNSNHFNSYNQQQNISPVIEEPMIEMSQISNKLSPVNIEEEDSMDIFNDDSFAQFCKPSEPTSYTNFNLFNEPLLTTDFSAERRLLEQDRRELAETVRINRINEELNQKIKALEESKIVKSNNLTSKDQLASFKVIMEDEEMKGIDEALLESQDSFKEFSAQLMYNSIGEELQRFFIFDIANSIERRFGKAKDDISLQLKESCSEFSSENYSIISQNVHYELRHDPPSSKSFVFQQFESVQEFKNLFEQFGVRLSGKNTKFDILCAEELVHVYSTLQANSKSIALLIRKLIDFQLKQKQPSDEISTFITTLYMCMDRCEPQTIFKSPEYNLFKSETFKLEKENTEALRKVSTHRIFSPSLLIDFDSVMKKSLVSSFNINNVVEMLLDTLGYNQEAPVLDISNITLNDLLKTIQHYLPPCFSQFIQTKSWINMSLVVRTLFKKLLTIILIQLTECKQVTKQDVLSNDNLSSEQLTSLFKHTLSFMTRLSDYCPIGNKNANFSSLHIFENLLSILEIIIDRPLPADEEVKCKEICSSLTASLASILPLENYRFFTSLQLSPFFDRIYPSKKLLSSGVNVVQKSISSFIKK